MLPVPAEHNPHWVYFADETGALRLSTGDGTPIGRGRTCPRRSTATGSVYVTRTRVVVEQDSLYGERLRGLSPGRGRSVNIDDPDDWDRAERMLLRLGVS